MIIKKVLITGGCGYIGSRVASILSEKYNVIVVDKVTPKENGIKFPKEIEFRKADLKIRTTADKALINMKPKELNSYRKKLQEHMKQFDIKIFKKKILGYINIDKNLYLK